MRERATRAETTMPFQVARIDVGRGGGKTSLQRSGKAGELLCEFRFGCSRCSRKFYEYSIAHAVINQRGWVSPRPSFSSRRLLPPPGIVDSHFTRRTAVVGHYFFESLESGPRAQQDRSTNNLPMTRETVPARRVVSDGNAALQHYLVVAGASLPVNVFDK